VRLKAEEIPHVVHSAAEPQPKDRARPDFARPTSRPAPRQGAPKRSDGGVVLMLEVQRSTGPVLVRLFRFAGLFAVSPTIEALLMAAVWAPAVRVTIETRRVGEIFRSEPGNFVPRWRDEISI